MEKIEKPKRVSSPEARNASPASVRLSKSERAELQAGADLAAEGNLGLYIRTLALRMHRRPPYSTVPLRELAADAYAEAARLLRSGELPPGVDVAAWLEQRAEETRKK